MACAAAITLVTAPELPAQRLGPSGLDEVATGTWTKLTNQPPFNTDSANLLTDGTVLVHQYNSNAWWKLTPDINGSYVNGTWSRWPPCRLVMLRSISPTQCCPTAG